MDLTPDDIVERTQWDTFWVPTDVFVVDQPEILYLSCPRDVAMLNTVTRTRASEDRLSELIGEVHRSHASVVSRWLVREDIGQPTLEQELGRAGYVPVQHHHVCVLSVSENLSRPAAGVYIEAVDSMPRLRDATCVLNRAFGGGVESTDEDLRDFLDACTRERARVFRVVAYDNHTGEPVSTGGMTFFPDLRFCYLWGGGTVPDYRGRGAYTAVLTARIERARSCGATRVGLYAVDSTSGPIVVHHGFSKHGKMVYWDRMP